MNYHLTEQDIRLIEEVINQGDRLEIIPANDDVRINLVKRKPIKKPKEKAKAT